MNRLNYEFEVLARAVRYKNLSAAAMHVGLSQPQLSRIISKIERELDVTILDRAVKRKSGWTRLALDLAQTFEKSLHRFDSELRALVQSSATEELRIGSLEGLSDVTISMARVAFESVGVKKVTLDLFDLSELQASFLSGHLDLAITSHIPGRQKMTYLHEMGYQTFEMVNTDLNYGVFSTFEFSQTSKKLAGRYKQVLISNSLAIKRKWFERYGGSGKMPSVLKKSKSDGSNPVYLLGSQTLSPTFWKQFIRSLKTVSGFK